MTGNKKNKPKKVNLLEKCPTGIQGIDEITLGGLPKARTTLICGGPGSGKTIFGMEVLIKGASFYNEPGLYVSFEETAADLIQNCVSLGYNLNNLIDANKLIIDHIHLDRNEFEETGAFNLDGLFIRLENTINTCKIKRIVLDTIEAIFSNLSNESILRSELQRLFRWFKLKGITVLVTAEKGKADYSRYGLEEYVADCVILLDHRMEKEISTRRLRIAKYRGSAHGNNEYPFIISSEGISVLAITSVRLDYDVSSEFVSTGIKTLDDMLNGQGFIRGSCILVSGPSGIGKSSFAAAFAEATCKSGEKCIYFAFEESTKQILRNMKSIGINLEKWIKKDLLRVYSISTPATGIESHLMTIMSAVKEFKPKAVILDPITNFKNIGPVLEVKNMLSRVVSYLKNNIITTLFTSLVPDKNEVPETEEGISSLMDVWVFLQYHNGVFVRTRTLSIRKSRGIEHSNLIQEMILSNRGIRLQKIENDNGNLLSKSSSFIKTPREEIQNLVGEAKFRYLEDQFKNSQLKLKTSLINEILKNQKGIIDDLLQEGECANELITNYREEISRRSKVKNVLKVVKPNIKEVKHGKQSKKIKNIGKKKI